MFKPMTLPCTFQSVRRRDRIHPILSSEVARAMDIGNPKNRTRRNSSSSTMEAKLQSCPKSSSIPICSICRTAQSAYCCPRCSTRTCSLKCCLEHKSRTGCNGKRDRTAFCSLARFTDAQLASDFHFLEDVLKCGERAGRFVREEMGVPLDGARRQDVASVMEDDMNNSRTSSGMDP